MVISLEIARQDPAYRATLLHSEILCETRGMKSMTCAQLGGACDLVITANSFDELSAQSQQHGKEMFGANDGPHIAAMSKMMELMKSGELDSWMAERKAEFEAL